MSGICREVITSQLGHYSNFVGTHWWNLQEASSSYDPESAPAEIQSDAVFREGQTPGGSVTYTPRLIAMDLKGSSRTSRQEGSSYDPGEGAAAVTWEGSVSVYKQSPPEKNCFSEDSEKSDKGENSAGADFCSASQSQHSAVSVDTFNSQSNRIQKNYRSEGSVKVWSDFSRIHSHPRTISVIHQYNHDGDTHRSETFGQGENLSQGASSDESEDKSHFFVEECDFSQGFQVSCDLTDGFSGSGSKVTESSRDSYGGRGISTWGVAPVGPRDPSPARDRFQSSNCCSGTSKMAANSSSFCPSTSRGGSGRRPPSPPAFPHSSYQPSLWYHSAAVSASASDAISAPYRSRSSGAPMWQSADSSAVSGRKVVAAYGAVPFPMMHGGSSPDASSACARALPWKPSSGCPEGGDGRCYGQWSTSRGSEDRQLVSRLAPGIKPTTPLHGLHSGEDVSAAYLSSFYPSAPSASQLVSAPSKSTPPFPQIFSPSSDARGFSRSAAPPAGAPVSSVPVSTSSQSGPVSDLWLSESQRDASGFDVRRSAPSFSSQGPEAADYQEASEASRRSARCYRDDSAGATRSSSEEEDED